MNNCYILLYLSIENVSFRLSLPIHCSMDGHDLKREKIEAVCLLIYLFFSKSVSMMKTYCKVVYTLKVR